jgi:hypothetical protein
MLANIVALASIWKIMKQENRELKSISGKDIGSEKQDNLQKEYKSE